MLNKITQNFKNIIIALSLIIVIAFGYRIYQDYNAKEELHQKLIGQQTKYEQLHDHAAKLEIKYRDQITLKDELEKNWKKEKAALKGKVKILSSATYLIREKARKMGKSDLIYEGKKVKYIFNEIKFNNGPPIGYVMIFDDGRVTSKVYNHKIVVKTAVSKEKSGKYNIASKAFFQLNSGFCKKCGPYKDWNNILHPLNIVGGTALVDPTEKKSRPKFHLWAPRFSAGFNASLKGFNPSLGVSLMGYGPSQRDLDFKFAHIGIQLGKESEDYGLSLVPVYYRPLRDLLPNTYIGAGINYNLDTNSNLFIGVNFNF